MGFSGGIKVFNECMLGKKKTRKFKANAQGTHVFRIRNMKLYAVEVVVVNVSLCSAQPILSFHGGNSAKWAGKREWIGFDVEAELGSKAFSVTGAGSETLLSEVKCSWVACLPETERYEVRIEVS